MNTNKAHDETMRWQWELNEAVVLQDGPDGHKKAVHYILEKLFQEIAMDIYQRDKDGNLKYSGNGMPKINWVGVITGLARLVGKVIFLRRAYDMLK